MNAARRRSLGLLLAAFPVLAGCAPKRPARAPEATPAPSPTPAAPRPAPTPIAVATPAPAPTPALPPPTPHPPAPGPAASPTPRAAPKPSPVARATAAPAPSAPAAPVPPPAGGVGAMVAAIEMLDRDGKKAPAADAVVWLPGLSGGGARPASLVQRNKQFEPHVVVVGKGGTVSFPNSDRLFHNVFSTTPGFRFDLGLYKGGSSKDQAFAQPGVVQVFCNIHPVMTAYVIVLDQPDPVFAITDASGRAKIAGVPAGAHKVRIWHEKGGDQEVTVDVPPGRDAAFGAVLDGSRWRKQPHKDKWGEDYSRKQRY